MLDKAKSQQWKRACALTQQSLLTILIQMKAEVTMEQWPSILAAESPGHTYGNLTALQTQGNSLGVFVIYIDVQ